MTWTFNPDQPPVDIDYVNHRSERGVRKIVPIRIHFSSSQWHPDRQYLLDAFDVDKQADRTFAMNSIRGWSVPACPPEYLHEPGGGRQDQISASIAKQLQRSMERNARMVNRLRKMLDAPIDARFVVEDGVRFCLEKIIRDEEPWPAL